MAAMKETREYFWVEGYGRFAKRSVVTVECVEERGKFYASLHTLNASPIGVGDTPDEAFAAWAARCKNAEAVKKPQGASRSPGR